MGKTIQQMIFMNGSTPRPAADKLPGGLTQDKKVKKIKTYLSRIGEFSRALFKN